MEDFVPYELAVKLKEKGFTLPKSNVVGKFDSDEVFHSQLYINFTETMDSEEIIAPTISQVLKWLREENKTHIGIHLCGSVYFYTIQKEYCFIDIPDDTYYNSYELAALAGIEYVIDNNLI